MSQGDMKPSRPWRELARLAAKEEDPQKVLELAREMIRALDAESNGRMESIAEEKSMAREKGAA